MEGKISDWFDQFVDDIETPQLRFLKFLIDLELDTRRES